MSRKKTAFVSGTITNNPLAIGDTTLNSAGLSSFPTIVSPDIGVIVLDPRGTAGAPEIVWVTAHTALATSATIVRAKEGSVARQHALGVAWVHGPTIMDFGNNKGTNIASAGTLTLPDTDEDYFHITGTTGITAISSRPGGKRIILEFDGILNITHNATSLILSSGATVVTRAGLVLEFISEDSGNWRQIGEEFFATAGLTPGGELGGTWASPTVDATHSGSAHFVGSESDNLGTQVTIAVQSTIYDSGTIILAAGTWLLIGVFNILQQVNGSNAFNCMIRDGANSVIVTKRVAIIGDASNGIQTIVTLPHVLGVGSSTTYKCSLQRITALTDGLFTGQIFGIKIA